MQNSNVTVSEDAQLIDWLEDYMTNDVDFGAPSRNEEYLKAREHIAESLMQPTELLDVPRNTQGGKMFYKLKVMARDERAKERQADIEFLRLDDFGKMNKARGNAHATLSYAKGLMANRPKFTVTRQDGAQFTCSTELKALAAVEKNRRFNRYGSASMLSKAHIPTS
jgi:hypothetical protein